MPPLDKNNGTWHLQFEGLFGSGVKRGKPFNKNLDMYPTFVDGALVNALATARTFNTSIHPMLESSVIIDSAANTLGGELVVLLTPDTWVPSHGKSTPVRMSLDGTITVSDDAISIAAPTVATHRDGDMLNFGGEDVQEITGRLTGAVGRTETIGRTVFGRQD